MEKTEQKKKTIGYAESLRDLWKGTKELAVCLEGTFFLTLADTLAYALKHFIVALLIVGIFIGMVVVTMQARAERDSAYVQTYHLEQSNDSLKIILGK